jgi:hypothetical protein
MKKINTVNLSAKRMSGNGEVKYCLWVNKEGELYIQLQENEEGGTFSSILFSVQKYVHNMDETSNLFGFDLNSGKEVRSKNRNDPAFLKAVLKNLID